MRNLYRAVRPKEDQLLLAEDGESDELTGDPLEVEAGAQGSGMEAVLGPRGGEGRGEEAEEGAIQAQEDVREVTTIKPPAMPTQEEVDLHKLTHIPYRC